MMELERLMVKVAATRAGLQVVEPPTLVGRSGATHTFSFLATDGFQSFAFDFYDRVGEVDLLSSYVKMMDTGVPVHIVCFRGNPSIEAEGGARDYRIRILRSGELAKFFEKRVAAAPA
ncbi:MAG TPA: hypothetical protein VEC02_07100 [Nitrososphaerales archaeon]|nr:hypothetical protein [Nitrososphaerales archaeon]